MVVDRRVLVLLGFDDVRRQPHMLEDAHDQSRRDPSQERGENHSPDHLM